jgi:hypothetical protein
MGAAGCTEAPARDHEQREAWLVQGGPTGNTAAIRSAAIWRPNGSVYRGGITHAVKAADNGKWQVSNMIADNRGSCCVARMGLEISAMRVTKRNIERRTVIEAYAKYDCSKTGRPTPDFATWDWSQADAIDKEMKCAQLKTGVPAGYLLWDQVEVTMSDLLECAVLADIFPGRSRKLGLVEQTGGLVGWKPNRETSWYSEIIQGQTFDETAPLMLRPALKIEFPASWYVEDGSGRVITFVANQSIFGPSQTLAIGYLGRQPDTRSSFMQGEPFRELIAG